MASVGLLAFIEKSSCERKAADSVGLLTFIQKSRHAIQSRLASITRPKRLESISEAPLLDTPKGGKASQTCDGDFSRSPPAKRVRKAQLQSDDGETDRPTRTGSSSEDDGDDWCALQLCEALTSPLPDLRDLMPTALLPPGPGKYGNPRDPELWHWYTSHGRKEVHPRAVEITTAGPLQCPSWGKKHVFRRFAGRPSTLSSIESRADHVASLDLGDAHCRLFIPRAQQHYFEHDAHGRLRLRRPLSGEAPFPVFTPSSGRSAADADVGLLDLSDTMLGDRGAPLDYVQVVAVKPSEVARYRSCAPFFVVMELPCTPTLDHPLYGEMRPEDLGVGCARHWLIKLADALDVDFVFMLDDSVRCWSGVTLVDDLQTHEKRKRHARMPLGQIMKYVSAQPKLRQFSIVGFARSIDPRSHVAHQRAHVYSAVVVNVKRLHREQRINFRQDLFLWEDIELNLRAVDVCKCCLFILTKQAFHSGGCAQYVARSEGHFSGRGAQERARKLLSLKM